MQSPPTALRLSFSALGCKQPSEGAAKARAAWEALRCLHIRCLGRSARLLPKASVEKLTRKATGGLLGNESRKTNEKRNGKQKARRHCCIRALSVWGNATGQSSGAWLTSRKKLHRRGFAIDETTGRKTDGAENGCCTHPNPCHRATRTHGQARRCKALGLGEVEGGTHREISWGDRWIGLRCRRKVFSDC